MRHDTARKAHIQSHTKRPREGADVDGDWPVAPPLETDLPAGEYTVAYRGFTKKEWFGQQKICLHFEVVDPRHCAGIEVPLYATLERRCSPRSKYYEIFVKAKGDPPCRKDSMSPQVFRGYWRVKVAWSIPKKGGHPMPQVIELIERVAGGPAI